MLYALSLESLLCKICASSTGLVLPGFSKSIVLSAYADDVIVMAQNQGGVDILVNLTDSFNVLSSTRVNWKKVRPPPFVGGAMISQSFPRIGAGRKML